MEYMELTRHVAAISHMIYYWYFQTVTTISMFDGVLDTIDPRNQFLDSSDVQQLTNFESSTNIYEKYTFHFINIAPLGGGSGQVLAFRTYQQGSNLLIFHFSETSKK